MTAKTMSRAFSKLQTQTRDKTQSQFELLLPYRKKNVILGLALGSMVFGLCILWYLILDSFAMYKATPASFPDLTAKEREELKSLMKKSENQSNKDSI